MTTGKTSVRNISPREFIRMKNKPLLIDVRSGLEYRSGHAPMAKNLSLPSLMFGSLPFLRSLLRPQWFRDLPKDRAIAVVCLTSHRSPLAAQQLAKEGFQKVFNISGGMANWQKLGLDIETGK